MDLGRFGTSVAHGDPNQDVLRFSLGILHEDVEIPVLIENACVEQFILGGQFVARPIGVDDDLVGVLSLRILVEVLHVRVGWRAVEVEVVLLDVLAVIALAVVQAEQALLEDGILPVPKSHREAKQLAIVGDACQPVFTPAISTELRLLVAEVIPGVAVGAVIFSYGPPLALTQIRSPFFPWGSSFDVLLKPSLFCAGFVCLLCVHGCCPEEYPLDITEYPICRSASQGVHEEHSGQRRITEPQVAADCNF